MLAKPLPSFDRDSSAGFTGSLLFDDLNLVNEEKCLTQDAYGCYLTLLYPPVDGRQVDAQELCRVLNGHQVRG